jgi:hypothetical protein
MIQTWPPCMLDKRQNFSKFLKHLQQINHYLNNTILTVTWFRHGLHACSMIIMNSINFDMICKWSSCMFNNDYE